MFKKSDYFFLLAVMISFAISAYLWFVLKDREQAIFTAIWVPSILCFGIYFKLAALLGTKP
jgi:phosphate starvation-inducible membrane PsiE